MAKWARVLDNTVGEVIDYDPYVQINPEYHSEYHPCDDDVEVYWTYDPSNQTFSAPVTPEPPAE